MALLTTALHPVPLVPEISLHLADAQVGLFDLTGGEFRSDEPPPFWAFVWAGGQALARYVLDHPDSVRGRTVLDLAAGSGVGGDRGRQGRRRRGDRERRDRPRPRRSGATPRPTA